MSQPIVYQPIPTSSALFNAVQHDPQIAYIFATLFNHASGSLALVKNPELAVTIIQESRDFGIVFVDKERYHRSWDRYAELAAQLLADRSDIINERLLLNGAQFDIEEYFENSCRLYLTNNQLDISELLFGRCYLAAPPAVGSMGDPLRVVYSDNIKSRLPVLKTLMKQAAPDRECFFAYDLDQWLTLLNRACDNGDAVIIGE